MRFKGTTSQANTPVIPFRQCWAKTAADGKPGISVLDHCRIVGHVAQALIAHLPYTVVRRLGDNPALVAALHDVGKVSPGFQLKYFRAALAQKGHQLARRHDGFDEWHAAVGELTLADVYGTGDGVPAVAQVVGAHHGSRRENARKSDLEYSAEGEEWPRERRRLISALEAEFGALGNPPETGLSTALLTGLVCVADWIGSDDTLFSPAGLSEDTPLAVLAEEAVSRCGWKRLDVRPGLEFEEVFGFAPYSMQRDVVDNIRQPGVYVLETPTGMGKTEAALFAAYRLMERGTAAGLYFGLPTRLTSDRIHRRVNSFLERIATDKRQARLAHGTAWLSRFDFEQGPTDFRNTESHPETWFNPNKRALLHPYAVGTIDQSLLGVLNVRHYFLRLFGLAGKVVILDEVHTYDMFTGTHLDALVNVLRQLDCTVIVLSATLTKQRRQTLFGGAATDDGDAYPLLTGSSGRGLSPLALLPPPSRSVRIRMRAWTPAQVANEAVESARRGLCVLCIANTVAQAQAWYCSILAEMPSGAFSVGLLHSKFVGAHRAEKEDVWMHQLGKEGERPEGCILVATQVVEQSVDIDADRLITELAPTDMLLQRLGRLWRHPRTNRPVAEPEIDIVSSDLPTDATPDELREALGVPNTYVYSPYVLCRSRAVWKRMDGASILVPDCVRELLTETYKTLDTEPEAWQALRQEQEQKREKLLRQANAVQIGNSGIPVGRDDERAATRYNDRPMRDVLLVRDIREQSGHVDLELITGDQVKVPRYGRDIHAVARMHQSTLSIAEFALPPAKTAPWLQNTVGANALVILCQDDGQLVCDGKQTGLAYDPQKGLVRHRCREQNMPSHFPRLDEYYQAYTDFETEDFFDESCDW